MPEFPPLNPIRAERDAARDVLRAQPLRIKGGIGSAEALERDLVPARELLRRTSG